MGRILAYVVFAVSAIICFVSFKLGVWTYLTLSFAAFLVVWIADMITRPATQKPTALFHWSWSYTDEEWEAFRFFHSYIQYKFASNAAADMLHVLRFWGLPLAIACFFEGRPWEGGAIVGYFFVVGGLVARLAPQLYIFEAAKAGDNSAMMQWMLIQNVLSKRETSSQEK